MNKVILIGNLGSAPEQKKNQAVIMPIATSTTDANGEVKKQWHRVVVFGKLGQACRRYLKTGSTVAIEGELRYGNFTDERGKTRKTASVVAFRVQFL